MKKVVFHLVLICFFYQANGQQPMEFPLYANNLVPNAKVAENLEKTAVNDWGVSFTTETSQPTLTYFEATKPNGKAVIVCPGGGYWGTAGDHEGIQVAKALNAQGITAFVLKYRVPSERTCINPALAPLQDAQQAIRTIRRDAAKWGIAPNQIGILGFSAGGHLAATAATHFHFKADSTCTDTTSVRPDFAVLIYPVISFSNVLTHGGSRDKLLGPAASEAQKVFFSNEKQVTADCPPVFLVHAQDDGAVPVGNSVAFYLACTQAGVPAEMHLYPKGGHGFGMHNPTTEDEWMERLFNWLKQSRHQNHIYPKFLKTYQTWINSLLFMR